MYIPIYKTMTGISPFHIYICLKEFQATYAYKQKLIPHMIVGWVTLFPFASTSSQTY